MGLKNIFEWVRNFLFSNLNKQFLVFCFFLLLAGVFWLTITLNDSYEQEIEVPIRVAGVPKNAVLTSKPTDTLKVTVRDKGWVVMAYLFNNKRQPINIPFKTYDLGNGKGIVGPAELKRHIEQALEISSKVTAIKPESWAFYYNNGQRKRVPVRWAGRVIPDQLFFISQVAYSPDSVDVFASKEKLDSIRAIYTEPLNYVNFRDSLSIHCLLAHPADVKVVPEKVMISFYTDVLTEETMKGIPIKCLNLPPGKALRTFPSKAKVHFVAGVSQIRSLNAEDFIVVADYKEITEKQQEKCTLYLRHVPQGVSHATLDVTQVDYLIEDEE